MPTPIIDLRSDTVTRPSAAMRKAMYEAEVGDDVYREDPTVNRLETRGAETFGREAGLFVVSGTMGNQAALKVLTRPGQEVICEERCHIYNFEMATMAAFSGVLPRTIYAEDGILTWDMIAPHVRPRNDYRARTGLVELENTANLAGGSVYPPANLRDILTHAHAEGLPVHLDGARIFNASVACGVPVVAPNSGGVLSYARADNAWLCEPSAEGLASAVRSVFADAVVRRERVRRARRTAEEHDWVLVAERFFWLIDTLHQRGWEIEEPPLGTALDAWLSRRRRRTA